MFNNNMKNTDSSGQVIEKVLPALVKTMAFTNPSGKQNSFAGNVLPSAILVEFKDYPVAVSYANAFVKPVRASYNVDLVTASVERLASFVSQVDKDFCLPVKKRFWFTAGLDSAVKLPVDLVGDTVNCCNFVELIDGVTGLVKSCG
jgi:CRISPR system Cascade subunit CasC